MNMKRRNIGFISGLAGGLLVASIATSLAGTMTSGSSGTSSSKPATTTTAGTTSTSAPSRLQVVDASGKLVGYPLDLGATINQSGYVGVNTSLNHVVLYSPTLKDVISIGMDGTPDNFGFFYTGPGCTGTPVSFEDFPTMGTRVKHATRLKATDPFVWYQADTTNMVPAAKSTLKILSGATGYQCDAVDIPSSSMSGTLVTWKPATAPFPSFTGPLKIVLGN